MKNPIKNPQRSSVVLWIIITAMLILVAVSVTLRRDEIPLETPPERAHPVHVLTIETQSVLDVIRLPGRIEPDMRAHLAVDKGGRVTERLADKGDRVTRDQVLLRIDDRTWRAYLEQAQIELREAEKEYQRWAELARAGMVSTSEYDVVRTRYDRAQVQRDEAQTHVDQCVVRSPAAGVINQRLIEIGEFAPEGSAVFELVVSNPVKLALDIPERDIAAVEMGAPMPFIVSILDNASFTGEVTHIAEAASPLNNSYRVEATVPNPERALRPGMIAEAQFQRARREEAVVVPLSAVIPRRGDHFVFVAQDDRAIRRLVKIDRILGADVILASGLEPGEELIYDGHRELIDGALIERVPPTDGQPAQPLNEASYNSALQWTVELCETTSTAPHDSALQHTPDTRHALPNADFIRNQTVEHGGKVSKTQPFPPYKKRVVGREWSLDLRAESNIRAFLHHLPAEDSNTRHPTPNTRPPC